MTNEKNIPIEEEAVKEEVKKEEVEHNSDVELTKENAETNAVEEETQPDPLAEKLQEIEVLKNKLEEAENRYLRLQADYDNSRRRSRLDMEAKEKYRAKELIEELLPAIDNFERALQIEADNEKTKSLLQGMEMVYRSLVNALKKEGVEVIEAVGNEFDPHLHQAVMQAEDKNYGSNIVVEEFQKGYKLKDKVIRPSMVKVNQ